MAKRGLIFGIGVNDAPYPVLRAAYVDGKRKNVWSCPYYTRWYSMLRRCYSKVYHKVQPTYMDCMVCEEWLLFSNFRKWMESQKWEDRELDKDFLVEGNKVYSPSTCIFIPKKLNAFLTLNGSNRGKYPLGVNLKTFYKDIRSESEKPYVSSISSKWRGGKRTHLGVYFTIEEAHQRYLQEKLSQCETYRKEYKDEKLIIKGLTRIRDKIQYHLNNKLELTSF